MRKINLWEAFLIAGIFFLLFFKLFELGIEYDEVLTTNAILGCPHSSMFLHYSKIALGRCVPLMLMEYIGAPVAFIPKISHVLFGASVYAFRGFNMFVVGSAIVLFFFFLKKRFSAVFAWLMIIFLMLDVQFIFTIQLDRPSVFPFTAKLFLIYLILVKEIRFRGFLIGVVSGLLIWGKVDNVFIVVPILVSAAFFSIKRKKVKASLGFVSKFLFGFFIATVPLLNYLRYNWKSFFALVDSYKIYRSGQDFIYQTEAFLKGLTNSDLYLYVFRQEIPVRYLTIFLAEILVFGWIIASLFILFNKKKEYRWFGLATILFFICYLRFPVMSGSHHRLLIYPLPQLVLASVFNQVLRESKNKFLLISFLVIYVVVFASIYTKTIGAINKTCGKLSFNCAIYPLATALKDEKNAVVVVDWGVATQLLYLSDGKLKIAEIAFEGLEKKLPEFTKVLRPYLDDCATVVLRYPGLAKFVASDQMTRQVLSLYSGYKGFTVQDKYGVPQYEIYSDSICR